MIKIEEHVKSIKCKYEKTKNTTNIVQSSSKMENWGCSHD